MCFAADPKMVQLAGRVPNRIAGVLIDSVTRALAGAPALPSLRRLNGKCRPAFLMAS